LCLGGDPPQADFIKFKDFKIKRLKLNKQPGKIKNPQGGRFNDAEPTRRIPFLHDAQEIAADSKRQRNIYV
jgi:hypothetical protein